jgi:hypothetical protein
VLPGPDCCGGAKSYWLGYVWCGGVMGWAAEDRGLPFPRVGRSQLWPLLRCRRMLPARHLHPRPYHRPIPLPVRELLPARGGGAVRVPCRDLLPGWIIGTDRLPAGVPLPARVRQSPPQPHPALRGLSHRETPSPLVQLRLRSSLSIQPRGLGKSGRRLAGESVGHELG